ncbi:TlpA disulfide reductase family protein [Phenylobacterium sp.]|jgi:thiol-disulfide isomerase/thioredoxin|uniref:TlpA family protein disulfide reductase n=1 Tax=Phenylobacterium sp. TaxID=1871053 RepID=UPI002E309839|nr:TlpA disulfide reductase family protein [Phenylobacterium sp.]HEX2561161.1 TlpA disulfide reductase family protein [Phenylobacterium sp.]
MSENPAAKPSGGFLKWALWGAAALGVAAVLYIIGAALIKPSGGGDLERLAKGEMAKLEVPLEPARAPSHVFYDVGGNPVRIADFKGQVVVMNIWATWCAPCVLEMPTLAALQKSYAGKPVKVVTVSVDQADDLAKAQAFIAKHAPLDFYIDRERKISFVLTPPAPGMPTTVIYGPDGVERARLAGEADWTSAEAKAVIDAVLDGG